MSREAVVTFFGRVRADSALRSSLGPAPTAASYVEQGNRAGFQFSVVELRSVTNAERFYERVQNDPALARRLSIASDEAAVVVLAKDAGLECQLEDLQAVLRTSIGAELSD